jgi:WD40 repeat protein
MAAAQALIRINPQNAVPALVPLLRPEDRLLRVETKEVAVLPGATCPVTYSPDGKLLVSGAAGEIKLWDSGTWKEQGTLGKGSTPAVFSPDGKFLAASGKGEVKVWEVKTGKHLATLVVRGTEYFVPLVFSADGKALATVSLKYEEGLSPYTVELKLWDLTSGKERAAPKPEDAPETIPVILRLASQGFLASTFLMDVQILCRDSRIDPCAIAEGRVQATLSVVGARSGIIDEASSLDGKVLAKVSARAGWLGTIPDDKVQLLDMVRGRDLVLEGHHQGILALAFSRDGKLLSSGDKNGTVILWDVASGRKLGVIEGPQGQKTEGGRPNWEPGSNSFFGNYLAFSPDGERLLLGGTWKGIKVWRIIPVDLLHDMKQK